jgi:hypothetical protein
VPSRNPSLEYGDLTSNGEAAAADPLGERCPSCGEAPGLHAFRCPESLPPRCYWGIGDARGLFGGATVTVIPFNQAAFATAFDGDLVADRLRFHPRSSDLVNADPRHLLATQPGVQRPAVEHYLGTKYEMWGLPFAEPGNPGNKYPVLYQYVHPMSGASEAMILSGHHRSTAALLRGRLLLARQITGPVWLRGGRR